MDVPSIIITAIVSTAIWNRPKINTNETEIFIEFNHCTISVRNKKLKIQKNALAVDETGREADLLIKRPSKDIKLLMGIDKASSVTSLALSLWFMYIAGTKEPFFISPDASVIISVGFAVAALIFWDCSIRGK